MAKDLGTLRDEAAQHVARGRLDKAIDAYTELEAREPASPQWSKKLAETHRRLGQMTAAIAAFERACERFVGDGFLVQAIAMCKLILQIDPRRSTAAHRLAALTAEARAPQGARPPAAAPAPKPVRVPAPARVPTAVRVPTPASGVPVKLASPGSAGARSSAQSIASPGFAGARSSAEGAAQSIASPGSAGARSSAEGAAQSIASPGFAGARSSAEGAAQSIASPGFAGARSSAEGAAQSIARPVTMPIARPVAVAPAARPPPRRSPTLPPSAPLDVLELSTLVPRARQLARDDGSMSGMFLLPIAEPGDDVELDDVEIEDIELSPQDAIVDGDAPTEGGASGASGELEWPAEVEVVEAAATPTRLELTQGAKLALLATPLFSRLPARALERLIAGMAFVQLEPGDLVFSEGDHGGTMYVISEGEVVVHSGERELARLGPGAFFGEIALVTELPRSATVRAATRVEVLAIDRDVIRDAIAARPAIVDVLLGFVRDRLVDRVARTSALFRPFSDLDRAQLSSRFELLEVVAGTAMLEMGVRADGLYVVLAGRVEVLRDRRHLASLGAGDVFGEMSLLSGAGASASVIASSRVLALRMPAAVFREVVMTHPQVLAHLGELADRRGAAGGDADDDILDLHLDLV